MSKFESLIPFIQNRTVDEKINIIVDSREATSAQKIITGLKELGVNLEITYVPQGDYIISNSCAIERKTVSDFAYTLTRRHLFEQLFMLKESFSCPVLILEGYLPVIYRFSKINPMSVWGALFSLAHQGISIIPTSSWKETIDFLYVAARQEQVIEKREPAIRRIKKAESLADKQLYLIAGLPRINNTRGEDLLDHFKTPRRIFSATKDELLDIRGIGEGIATAITEVLDAQYSCKKHKKEIE
jgi:ERCC4-type nuclease